MTKQSIIGGNIKTIKHLNSHAIMLTGMHPAYIGPWLLLESMVERGKLDYFRRVPDTIMIFFITSNSIQKIRDH